MCNSYTFSHDKQNDFKFGMFKTIWLSKNEAVTEANVNYATGKATVSFDEKNLSEQERKSKNLPFQYRSCRGWW